MPKILCFTLGHLSTSKEPLLKTFSLSLGLNGDRLDDVAAQIGEAIAKLHDGGLAHGDVTTSNMLVKSGTNQLVN
ncbi:unnamed protein product [Arabis nemorensis]|uniref:non-specific serine/threonine protein kinase n=1 Tax=Arabis nemorensis TaxID=586526 RepID=A0A565BFF4_9BRAS|nr:unnamed protein product [Arabis nemorensis]